jgi:hypothetical protein
MPLIIKKESYSEIGSRLGKFSMTLATRFNKADSNCWFSSMFSRETSFEGEGSASTAVPAAGFSALKKAGNINQIGAGMLKPNPKVWQSELISNLPILEPISNQDYNNSPRLYFELRSVAVF